jgi:hypothetical protein
MTARRRDAPALQRFGCMNPAILKMSKAASDVTKK